ncbi:hypothetical protein FKM82_015416 [Ascaphus truei]
MFIFTTPKWLIQRSYDALQSCLCVYIYIYNILCYIIQYMHYIIYVCAAYLILCVKYFVYFSIKNAFRNGTFHLNCVPTGKRVSLYNVSLSNAILSNALCRITEDYLYIKSVY